MVFNVLAHNRGDHFENVSYLAEKDGLWRLSPTYDLVFAEGPRERHAMAVAGEAEHPGEPDLLRVAEDCEVDWRRALAAIQEVRAVAGAWPRFAHEAGVPPATERRIGRRIAAVLHG